MHIPIELDISGEIHKLPSGFTEIINELIDKNTVHEDDFNYFKDYDPNTTVFIDVGSNIGNSAISITNVCGKVKIFGFEPNVMLSGFLDRAKLHNDKYNYSLVGLSDKEGVFDLYVPIVDNMIIAGESSTSYEHFYEEIVSNRLSSYSKNGKFHLVKVPCKVERLDSQQYLFEAASLAERRVIKIDTEGTEIKVLLGGLEFINKFRPTLMIEDGSRDEIASLLSQLGYSQYIYDKDLHRLQDAFMRSGLNSFYVYRGI